MMQIGIDGYEEGKGKDNEALFNTTYYFNSLGHEILCDITNIHLQILTLLYLHSSTLLICPFQLYASISANPPISKLRLI